MNQDLKRELSDMLDQVALRAARSGKTYYDNLAFRLINSTYHLDRQEMIKFYCSKKNDYMKTES